MPPPDRDQLYERASQGDAPSLDRLLEHYLPQLHAFVRLRLGAWVRCRESSMDVVQSVCRQLLAARDGFDFRGEELFRAWLFTSALNKIREKHRHHQLAIRDVAREDPEAGTQALLQAAQQITPSQEAAAREVASVLDGALAAMSEDHREVITLARVAGLPHRAIAEVLGRSEEAVRQLLARALLRLYAELRARGVRLEPET
ncbi:MAG: sigma-70 family RNA polymerase sigma factor [Planctomycetes bacterium]|nr:sigma-70 family RNA polymerase sigma factor [Planctomycetota bacterium]